MIQSAKVTFSKIGVISAIVTSSKNGVASQEKKGTLFMPRVVLQIEGRKSLKTGYLQLSRFDKKDYQGLAVLPDFHRNNYQSSVYHSRRRHRRKKSNQPQ